MDSSQLPPHHSLGPQLLGWQFSAFALGTIALVPRLYFRILVFKNCGLDDVLITLSWVFSLWACISITEAVKYGYGSHLVYAKDVRLVLFWSTPCEITSIPGVVLVKLSICWFILRFIVGAKGKLHRLTRILVGVNVSILIPVGLATMLVFIFQCIPLSALWNELFPPNKCLDRHVVDAVSALFASVSAFTDILTVCLPILILYFTKMDRHVKIGVGLLIGLGLIICGLAIAKAVTSVGVFPFPDPTYALIPVTITTLLEHQLGIFVACMPANAPALRKTYTGLRSVASFILNSLRRASSSQHDESNPPGPNPPVQTAARTALTVEACATGRPLQDHEHIDDAHSQGIKVVHKVETFQEEM